MLLFLLVFVVRISLLFFFFHEEHEDIPLSWSFFGSSVFLVVKNPYDLRSQIRFGFLPEKRTLSVGCIVWTTNGCWPFPPNYFWTRLNSLSVSTSSFAQQNTPPLQANWQHDTKTPSFDASYRAWRNGTKVGQISSSFFINTVLKMKVLRCSRRPTHRLDQQHQAPFLTPFPAEETCFSSQLFWVSTTF